MAGATEVLAKLDNLASTPLYNEMALNGAFRNADSHVGTTRSACVQERIRLAPTDAPRFVVVRR